MWTHQLCTQVFSHTYHEISIALCIGIALATLGQGKQFFALFVEKQATCIQLFHVHCACWELFILQPIQNAKLCVQCFLGGV